VARIRPITPGDADAWRAFHSRLSQHSIQLRFFAPHPDPSPAEIEHFVRVDYVDRMAFVVEQDGAIRGIGRYDGIEPATAEIAFVVEDADQGRGIGTLLLEYLVAYASAQGLLRFVADTLVDNTQMLGVFRGAGFREQTSTSAGVTRVVLDLTLTGAMRRRIDELEWQADVASVRRILEPRTIAVLGTSRSGSGIGNRVLANLVEGRLRGRLAAINPHADPHVAGGVTWCRAMTDCPFPIDLAVVAVPPAAILTVIDDCASAGVHALVVLTSGFAEAGADGVHLQSAIVERAHRAGIRIVGPNCLGIVNTASDVSMNATFASTLVRPGRVALASQSGAVGIALLEQTRKLDLGVSSFLSMGNKADVSGNDLLRYWYRDTATRVILLYLESLGNPRKFFDIARTVSRIKPIVVMKSGCSVAGARAAASHTAAMASPDRAVDTLFAQGGVVRAMSLEEMLALGALFDHTRAPCGSRIAVIGNAGGAGVLAVDTADEVDLTVEPLPPAMQERLRALVPGAATVENPVDLGAGCTPEVFAHALDCLAACPEVDAVVAIHADVPQLPTSAFVELASATAARTETPVIAVTLGVDSHEHAPIALFTFPENAVRCLARLVAYGRWRDTDPGTVPALAGVDVGAAREVVRRVLSDHPHGRWLDPHGFGHAARGVRPATHRGAPCPHP
jgi:acyl-CoA synthetase (NDP forming)/RimJ/RimL family protein N-acetyltransferase